MISMFLSGMSDDFNVEIISILHDLMLIYVVVTYMRCLRSFFSVVAKNRIEQLWAGVLRGDRRPKVQLPGSIEEERGV